MTILLFNKNRFLRMVAFLQCMLIVICCEDDNPQVDVNENEPVIEEDTIRFSDLRNTFKNKCYHCHSREFSFFALEIDTYDNTMLGSINGPIVIPYEPESSLLYTKSAGLHSMGDRMPYDDNNFFDREPDKLQLIYDWILYGCLE